MASHSDLRFWSQLQHVVCPDRRGSEDALFITWRALSAPHYVRVSCDFLKCCNAPALNLLSLTTRKGTIFVLVPEDNGRRVLNRVVL